MPGPALSRLAGCYPSAGQSERQPSQSLDTEGGVIFETERASYKVMLVARLPRPDPPITDRDCMPPGPALLRRLARQVVPRARIRDCCWHHRIDWRQASAAAVAIAR